MPRTPSFVVPVRDLVGGLTTDARFAPQIAAARRLPAAAARHAPWPADLAAPVRRAAEALGFEPLYTHQAAAARLALAGHDVAQVAGTAAGKSLGYVLPMLDGLVRDPRARALLVFPTKALAQDQLERLRQWQAALPEHDLAAAAYDGDTPSSARARVRRTARIVVTNPDMLHAGILPRHTAWSTWLAGLTDVVVDEMHVYRGVFGSHVANVMRRLRRVAAFHGARPRFHLTSATIANPGELARLLTGRPVAVVDDDGAPRGARTFVVYNPPIVDDVLNLRRSPVLEAEALARHFLDGGVQTIVFAGSRHNTELIVRYLNEAGGGAPRGRRRRRPARRRAWGRRPRRRASGATGAATRPASGGSSRRRCATGRCRAWWPPTRWSSASTSARSTRASSPGIPARSPARGSRPAAPGGGRARRRRCSSWAGRRSTSSSRAIRTTSSGARRSTPGWIPTTS